MKKLIFLSVCLILFVSIAAGYSFAQDSTPPADTPTDTSYEEWLQENKRIEEENKRIDEANKKIDELNRQDQERYNKQLEEYNNKKKEREDRMNSIKNRPVPTPKSYTPPRVIVTAPVNPEIIIFVQKQGELVDEKVKKAETEAIGKINTALKSKNITIKKDYQDTVTLTSRGVTVFVPFPLLVNIESKEIQVVTSKGNKPFAIFPYFAFDKLQNTAQLSEIKTPFLLEEQNDRPVLVTQAKKTFKIFRFITVSRTMRIRVSAENGEINMSPLDFLTSILQKLSF